MRGAGASVALTAELASGLESHPHKDILDDCSASYQATLDKYATPDLCGADTELLRQRQRQTHEEMTKSHVLTATTTAPPAVELTTPSPTSNAAQTKRRRAVGGGCCGSRPSSR